MEKLNDFLMHSPVTTISNTLSGKEGFTIDADIESTENSIELSLSVMPQKKRILTSGEIHSTDRTQAFSLYLDSNILAVTSDSESEEYYGITFETFQQNIREIPLISWIIQESTIKKWNNSLQKIPRQLDEMRYFFVSPDFDIDTISELAKLIWIMPAEMQKTSLLHNNKNTPFLRVVYRVPRSRIATYLMKHLNDTEFSQEEITATFYLKKNTLQMSEIMVHKNGELIKLSVEQSPDSLRFTVQSETEEGSDELSVFWEDDKSEHWMILNKQYSHNIEWNANDRQIRLDNGRNSATGYYQPLENGFYIDMEDLESLMAFLGLGNMQSEWNGSCKMSISKGADLQVPEYKNLDEWSLEDFLSLLDGIGNLIGLKLN